MTEEQAKHDTNQFDAVKWLKRRAERHRSPNDPVMMRLSDRFKAAADELEQARARLAELERVFACLPQHHTPACSKHLEQSYEEDSCPWCRIAELEAAIQSAREDAQRDVIAHRIGYDRTPCSECSGLGTKVYGSTATWRGGIGGQMITDDVCDRCWGSGDADMPWPSWRKSDAELGDVLKAAREDKLFQELEHRYMTVCADLDRLRSENEYLRERISYVGSVNESLKEIADDALSLAEPKESGDE